MIAILSMQYTECVTIHQPRPLNDASSGIACGEEREERYAAMIIKGKRLCVFGTRGGVRCASRGVHRWVAHALESDTQ